MTPFVGELVGTALFVLLGNAVQSNVLLSRTKAADAALGGSAWLLIATGWAMALLVGVAVSSHASGAHLNPVVTLAIWNSGRSMPGGVGSYLAGQFLGAAIGAALVFLVFLPHWSRSDDPTRKLACFATTPAVRAPLSNCFAEAVATFVFVFGLLAFRHATIAPATGAVPSSVQVIASVDVELGAIGAVPLALLYWAISLGLGGTTNFALNPARDFAPRFIHAIAPISGKGSSDWSYAWVPIVGPLIGGLAAALFAGAVLS